MINFGKVKSRNKPKEIEITSSLVYIASDIHKISEIIGNQIIEEYEYQSIGYNKDEYLLMLTQQNKDLKESLLDTQAALCEIYEQLL